MKRKFARYSGILIWFSLFVMIGNFVAYKNLPGKLPEQKVWNNISQQPELNFQTKRK